MDEAIDTRTADGFLRAFAPTARSGFDRRMGRVARYLADLEADPSAFKAFGLLVAMDATVRSATIGQAVDDTSGADSLDGVESLVLFLNAYMLLGHACHAVSHVPSDRLQAVFDGHAYPSSRSSPDHVRGRKQLWLAEQSRFAEIREGADTEKRSLSPAEILACVERNVRVHTELAEARDVALWRAREERSAHVPPSPAVTSE